MRGAHGCDFVGAVPEFSFSTIPRFKVTEFTCNREFLRDRDQPHPLTLHSGLLLFLDDVAFPHLLLHFPSTKAVL